MWLTDRLCLQQRRKYLVWFDRKLRMRNASSTPPSLGFNSRDVSCSTQHEGQRHGAYICHAEHPLLMHVCLDQLYVCMLRTPCRRLWNSQH